MVDIQNINGYGIEAEMSVPDTTVRLSIGLEAPEDLLEDIEQAVK